ncbi:MAG: hypothetical protein HGA76_02190 [Candidatus Firestonebacteria bacterium]|nr:hypothetical protein [Candidatus Firestonebacteria bacterium]
MPSKILCLSGMDGTGKTTQAQELVRQCRAAGYRAGYLWARWEPFFLRPIIERYFKKKNISGRAGTDFKQASQAKAKMLQRVWVRRAWRWFSILDYWLTKRPRIFWAARKWDILILDRYVYDFAIDQALNSGISPAEMAADLEKRIFKFFPRPDRTLVLLLSAEEGSRRKQDGTGVGYLQARNAYYQALVHCPGAIGVDASGTIPEVQSAIWQQIQPWLREA